MKVSVRLFATLRERAGRDEVDLELPDGATVAEAMEALRGEPGLAEPLGRMRVAMAVNRDYADPDTHLAAGDELALVPPVSGGGGVAVEVHARVTDEPLSLEDVTARVLELGGTVVDDQVHDETRWRVCADPEGNPFCLVPG
jgi:molybdopterin synthase catalytic subunit